ncbi:DUF2017 family protein [Phragmitibacter flavus]|uniref:DUF2017 family protein n=1 Tax=Phragmitibacter flavus TaxID=2576071 RepID=A0A5R8KJV3_9BACT|nr:DUF2017 family protein [Phragmitibacter flavus]TLD72215.1 DUF2017 family protein [Phragmitibacter flavus]
MRLTLLKEQELWQLSDMEEVHVELLRQAADDASMTDCPEGRQRLFPSPVPQDQRLREGEFLEDWNEYVTGELDTQFAEDVGTLLADLDGVEIHHTADEEPIDPRYLVKVPLDHAGAWFSSLNQARLMLDLKYALHPDGEHLQLQLDAGLDEGETLHERLAAYMRYEFFALIQEWLVRQVMAADQE